MGQDIEVSLDLAIKQATRDINKVGQRMDGLEKGIKRNMKGANSALNVFKGTLGALGVAKVFGAATQAASRFFQTIVTDGIAAAQVQQEAVNNMEVALGRFGDTSQEASQDIQDFASNLQKTTTVGDETALEMFALSAAFTDSAEKAKLATQAAVELSAVAQISLSEATRRVGRAFQGSTEDVSKFAPAIKNLTKAQLENGDAARAIIAALGGSAASKIVTYAGAVTQAENSFGDFTEKIGDNIVKNKSIISLINTSSKMFGQWGDEVVKNKGQIQDLIGGGLIKLMDGLSLTLTIMDGVARFFKVTWLTIELGVATAITGIIAQVDLLATPLRVIGEGLEALGQKNPFADMFESLDGMVVAGVEDMERIGTEIVNTFSEEGALGIAASGVDAFKDNFIQAQADMQGAIVKTGETSVKVDNKKKAEAVKLNAWQQTHEKGKLAFAGKVASNLVGLQQSKSKELFAIGKASNIATGIMNTYTGATEALKLPVPFGFIAAGAVIAAGLANVANITSQNFANGGIVGGNSLSGDRVQANVNSREMIINTEQQAQLFAQANGAGGGGSININIEGNVIADDDSQVDSMIEKITEAVKFRNAQLTATATI